MKLDVITLGESGQRRGGLLTKKWGLVVFRSWGNEEAAVEEA
jgi:hypothetical protein